MRVNIVKLSKFRIPRQFIAAWMKSLVKELKSLHPELIKTEVNVVFVTAREMKKLNFQYRKKNSVTDILSFSSEIDGELGELVLCGEILQVQAIDHKLSFKEELGYMLIHGALHLLGYEHENSGQKAKEMFQLQDKVFAQLSSKYFN